MISHAFGFWIGFSIGLGAYLFVWTYRLRRKRLRLEAEFTKNFRGFRKAFHNHNTTAMLHYNEQCQAIHEELARL